MIIPALLLAFTAPAPLLAKTKARPTITLNCNNCDLQDVLKKCAKKMGQNIYIGPGVSGKVTANLVNVPAERALGLALSMQPVEYRYKIVGNTIIVGTPEKLRQVPDDVFRIK